MKKAFLTSLAKNPLSKRLWKGIKGLQVMFYEMQAHHVCFLEDVHSAYQP